MNAAHRRKGAVRVSKQPMADLGLQRQAMEPSRQLLQRQFAVAGQDWEEEQECQVLEASPRGHVGWSSRQYRMSVAASCRDEDTFFRQADRRAVAAALAAPSSSLARRSSAAGSRRIGSHRYCSE